MNRQRNNDLLNQVAVALDPQFANVIRLQDAQAARRQDASANEWLQNFARAATPEEQALRVQQLPNVIQDPQRQEKALQMADQIRARVDAPKLEAFRRDADVIFTPDVRTGRNLERGEARDLLTQFAVDKNVPVTSALGMYGYGPEEVAGAKQGGKPEYRQGADGRWYAIAGTSAIPVEGTPATQAEPKAPTHRTIKRGDKYVTQDWTPQQGWVDTESAPRETASGSGDSAEKKDRTEARQMFNALYPVSFMGERVPGAPEYEEFYTQRWQTLKQLSESSPEQYQQVLDAAAYLQDPEVPEAEKGPVSQRFKEFFGSMFAQSEVNDRFKKDKQMKGFVLGAQTPQGFEVRDGNGRIVGYYD